MQNADGPFVLGQDLRQTLVAVRRFVDARSAELEAFPRDPLAHHLRTPLAGSFSLAGFPVTLTFRLPPAHPPPCAVHGRVQRVSRVLMFDAFDDHRDEDAAHTLYSTVHGAGREASRDLVTEPAGSE